MHKRILATFAVFIVVGICIFGACSLVEPKSGIYTITSESPCPTTQCASGQCHGFDNVPDPDGIHEMTCPESSCSSVECHAWNSLVDRYHQASDASLNLWILAPVALVVGLVILVRVLSKGGTDEH